MIRLHQFPPVFGRNVSPVHSQARDVAPAPGCPMRSFHRSPGRGPKGKLPFIEDDDGTVLGNSLIIEHLMRTRGPPRRWPRAAPACAGARAATADRGSPLLHRRMEPLGGPRGLAGLRARACSGRCRNRSAGSSRLSSAGSARASLRAQGLGRHSQTELYAMGRADLEGDLPGFASDPSSSASVRPPSMRSPTAASTVCSTCRSRPSSSGSRRVFPTLPLTARA